MKSRLQREKFRKLRTRKKLFGTAERPRLSVFRSLKHISAQVIDDNTGTTLVASTSDAKVVKVKGGLQKAVFVGEDLGKKAISKGIETVVYDRGSRPYTGRVKALADAALKAGLVF